ncbi:type II secretion system F family protein [uncultured Clostridium sp.]|uniref:type II secretion system F family protein n=1 Tax=uncultured Clostridium sp. TaxID=59620 RepID=UPI0025DA7F58|nr:type II secretion system F family protein [uncultured Clostridium sp.]
MGRYKYRAMNSDNEKIEGKYEAKTKDEVIEFIESNGMYPLLVEEIVQSRDVKFGVNRKVKVKDIAIMSRQFYTMLETGVPILECLNILSNQIENNKLRECITEIAADINKGGVLSDCMKKHKKVFPSLFISLVASGEASGRLDTVMLRMANYYEKETKTANKVKSAMIYPCVLAFVAVVAVTFILVYVMPTFIEVFEGTGTQLPWNTRLLLWLSSAIQNNWIAILIVLGAGIFGGKYYFGTEQGKYTVSRLQLKIPFIKKLNQMSIVSQFTRTMSMLIGSGIPLIDSIVIVTDVVKNKIAKDALMTVNERISRGEGLYYSIEETGIFPKMLCSMVRIGEETGALDSILNKTADFYDEELDSTIQVTVSLMEPALIVVMGIVIGFIVISIMLPMFDMYSQIG